MQAVFLLFAVLATATLGTFYPFMMPVVMGVSLLLLGYTGWQYRKKGFKPQSDTYKALAKIKKKREKTEKNKHKHINDQIAYIKEVWGYTQEQEKIINKFVQSRAYTHMYNQLTASLFPQVITLIDQCIQKDKKGCSREVSKRLRALTNLMKEELKKKKSQNEQSFETSLEVYDQLLLRKR